MTIVNFFIKTYSILFTQYMYKISCKIQKYFQHAFSPRAYWPHPTHLPQALRFSKKHSPSRLKRIELIIKKKLLIVPWLGLVATHMVSKLMENARRALRKHQITRCFSWTDSTVTLHWSREEKGQYKQFVSNIVGKIWEKKYVSWQYVPTIENCTNVGSTGCFGNKLPSMWFTGPSWVREEELWLKNIIKTSTPESSTESKGIQIALKSALPSKHHYQYYYQKVEQKDLEHFKS